LIQNEGVTESTIPQIDVRILKVPEAKLQHALDALSHHTMIEFVEPDYLLPPNATPNDTYYSSQWHLPRIQAPQAWDISTGASSVILAILDTGIDATHPDLAPKLVAGWNFYDNNSDTTEVYPHGTAVAGTAAALGNNGLGVASLHRATQPRFWGVRPTRLRGFRNCG